MSKGCIYVLQNNSHGPYVVKIGLTTRTPDVRSKEIYWGATGVPEPFDIAAAFSVGDCEVAEKKVHEQLATYRINERREFFKIPPKIACSLAYDVCRTINNDLGLCAPEVFEFVEKTVVAEKKSLVEWFVGEKAGEMKVEYRKISELKQSPIGTSTLTQEQLDRVRILQMIFEVVFPKSIVQWYEEFSRDSIPEYEILAWEKIAKVFLEVDQVEVVSKEAKKEAFGLILLRSLCPKDQVYNKFERKHLSENAVAKILSLCK